VITFWSRRYVAHLEGEIAYLRQQVEHERDRAERAVDELLRVRVQGMPISEPSQMAPAEDVVQRLLNNTEWAQAGEAATDTL
jgi:hypothetical protein